MLRNTWLGPCSLGRGKSLCCNFLSGDAKIKCLSLICFHYFRPPLIKRPPDFALPDPAEDPSWYGEIWLKYPGSKRLYPSSSGSVFKARADFAVILNEAGQRLFGETGLSRKLSVPEIAEFYSRFKSWYSDLPGSISPREALLPSHLKLQ